MSDTVPKWLATLTEEETHFLKRFLLCSGSLKALAAEYGVSYPTIRQRLNRTIEKVKAAEMRGGEDAFERLVQLLVDEGVLVSGTARTLLHAHKRVIFESTHAGDRDVFHGHPHLT